MSLNNPQIQFVRYKETGLADRIFVYATSTFSESNFENDGVISITGPDISGKVTVSLGVKQEGLALRLNKPVIHQVELVSMDPDEIVDIEVKLYNDIVLLNTVILHHAESETVVKPIPGTRI
jgi:hypothetical protein